MGGKKMWQLAAAEAAQEAIRKAQVCVCVRLCVYIYVYIPKEGIFDNLNPKPQTLNRW